MASESTSVRSFGLVLAGIAAWLIFAVGLLAPLTPSEGMPSIPAVLTFVGLPIGLLGVVAAKAREGLFRGAALVQGTVIIATTAWLLGAQAHWW